MYPIFINLRAESGLRASVCAHMPVEVQTKHFVIRVGVGGVYSAAPVDSAPPTPPGLWLHTVPYRFVIYELCSRMTIFTRDITLK